MSDSDLDKLHLSDIKVNVLEQNTVVVFFLNKTYLSFETSINVCRFKKKKKTYLSFETSINIHTGVFFFKQNLPFI